MQKKQGPKIGRHGSFSSMRVASLQDEINAILREYGDVVYQATEAGLDAAAYTLLAKLKIATPKKTKMFSKRWKVEKYKMARYIGNSTVVTDKAGNEISLANIFEYSTIRGKPFVKQTYEDAIPEMVAAVVAEIKKEA